MSSQKCKPIRHQLKRIKGYKKPPHAVTVARPTKWGNPFNWVDFTGTLESERRRKAVDYYRDWLEGGGPVDQDLREEIMESLEELRGKDLACWCPLDQPCHADVLIELANQDSEKN